jgi:hypothetical protein
MILKFKEMTLLAFLENFGGFPLIGAIANCSSYQNPRRGDNLTASGNLMGLFNTRTGAKFARIKIVCNCPWFIIVSFDRN